MSRGLGEIRCGRRVMVLTRVRVAAIVLALLAVGYSLPSFHTPQTVVSYQDSVSVKGGVDVQAPVVGGNLRNSNSGNGGDSSNGNVVKPKTTKKKGKKGKKKTKKKKANSGPVGPFCKDRTNFEAAVHPYEVTTVTKKMKDFCSWSPPTKVVLPFKVCTFDIERDRHVSKYVHEAGKWEASKSDFVEASLPVGGLKGRKLAIDIGSNVGFYSGLLASRGYDVIAVEANKEAAEKTAATLEQIPVAPGLERGTHRVFAAAASDTVEFLDIRIHQDNPGASKSEFNSAPHRERPNTVKSLVIDDLFGPKKLDPKSVAFIKIAAEGFDARALSGMRTLLGVGEVPLVTMRFHKSGIVDAQCSPNKLLAAMTDAGYIAFLEGKFYRTEAELKALVKDMNERAFEMQFFPKSSLLDNE